MKSTEFNISNRTIFRILAIIVAFVVGVYLVVQLYQPLLWVGISFFFALALEPPVNWLSSKLPGKSRGLAVLMVIALAIGIISIVIYVFAPTITQQFQQLVKGLPTYYRQFLDYHNPISEYLKSHNPATALSLNGEKLTSFASSTSGGVVSVFAKIFGSIFAFFTIIVFTFFMVLEWPKWHELFWQYQNPQKRAHRKHLYAQMAKTVSGYVNGNLLTSLIAGIATIILLLILRNPYAVALGVLVMVLDLIPMLGATLAAVIVTAVVLIYGGVTPALVTLIFFIVYQQLENNVLQPMIFSKTVKISPLVAGIAALFGAVLAGLIGALVAIPVAASLQILVKDYLDRKYPNTRKSVKK